MSPVQLRMCVAEAMLSDADEGWGRYWIQEPATTSIVTRWACVGVGVGLFGCSRLVCFTAGNRSK